MAGGIKIGRLRHRITLERRVSGKGGMGQRKETWEYVGSLWASVRPVKASEGVGAQAEQAVITHDVLIRYRQGMSAKMRIVWGARVFELVAPPKNINEENRFLLCSCEERFS